MRLTIAGPGRASLISGRVSLILRLDEVESGAFLPLIVPVWNEFSPCIRPENVVELCLSGATA